jgi:hypothetical protein
VYGALSPPGPLKTFFMTEYEDLFSYSKELSLRSYLAWGLRHIVSSKLQMAAANAQTLYMFLGGLVPIFALGGALDDFTSTEGRRRRHLYVAPIFLLALLLVFYSFVATILPAKGGLVRSLVAVAPFLVVMAVDALNRHVRSRAIFMTALVLTAAAFAGESVSSTRAFMASDARLGRDMEEAGRIIGEDARSEAAREIVVMTRDPWEFFQSTRYRSVQIPNEDREVICQVALRYGASYLLLPAPRKALNPLYAEEETDPRFPLISRVPDSNLKVFGIRCGT